MKPALRTFEVAPPRISEGRLFRLVSEDGYEIYVLPVMYGYRIQSVRKGDLGPRVDWCAGSDLRFVALMLEVMEHLLTYHDDGALPKFSQVRPVHLDLTFMGKLSEMADPNRPQRFYHAKLEGLDQLRTQYYASLRIDFR